MEEKKNTLEKPVPASSEQEGEEMTIDLMELARHLLAHWKWIVATAVIFTLIVGAYTSFMVTPMYKATSTIYVLSRRDSAINMSDLQIGTALTQDYAKVFRIWEVHEKVISNLGLPYSYNYMSSHLSVVNDSGTRMLDISFTSPDPNEAANVANEYAKVSSEFIAETMATDQPSIMSVALIPSSPVSPSLVKNCLMGMIVGVVLSCGVFTVQMLMDDKYKSSDDILKYTGLTTLAMIPAEEEEKRKKTKNSPERSRDA